MSTLPRYTAQGTQYVPSVPTRIYEDPAMTALEQVGHEGQRLGTTLSNLAIRIGQQQSETEATQAFNKWREGEASIHAGVFQADPNDPEAVIPPLKGAEATYAAQMADLRATLSEPLSQQGRLMFNKAVDQHGASQLIKLRGDVLSAAALQEKGQLVAMGDDDARRAAMTFGPARDEIIANHISRLGRAERRGIISGNDLAVLTDRFQQKTLKEQANILSRSPEGRQTLYEMVDKGGFDKLDPDTLSRIVARAQAADQRVEKSDRENEVKLKAAYNDREIEIGELVAGRKPLEAQARLEFYTELRLLMSDDIEKWRKTIAAPPLTRVSDPSVAWVMLDVESSNPRVTEAEIDNLYQQHEKGLPGLSLPDAIKAKSQLRQTRTQQRNRAEDQALATKGREHGQAEQELRALLNIKPDFVVQKMADDPSGRAYARLLPELRKRSYYYDGSENPLKVVESMVPRINEYLGASSRLSSSDIKALYPDVQSLERARRENRIDQDQLDSALQGYRNIPPQRTVPGVTAPTTERKSKSYGR